MCKLALNEDLFPSGDITSNLLDYNYYKKIKLISNQRGIIGGLEFAKQTFNLLDKKIKFVAKKKEGSLIKIYASVDKIGNTSVTLNMEARSHSVYNGAQKVILSTKIKFVRIDEQGDSIPISERVRVKYS